MRHAYAVVLAGLMGLTATTAQAYCPPVVNDLYSALSLYNYDNNHSHETYTYLGRVDFFGALALAAVVQDYTTGTCSAHFIVDENTQLLAGLPKSENQLCMGGGADNVTVLTSNMTVCNTALTPFNYSGRRLLLNGEGGADTLSGGNGVEVLEGSSSGDVLWDGSSNQYFGDIKGGSGSDQLYGSTQNYTYFDAASGNDVIVDDGGDREDISAGSDNDCVWDSNAKWSYLHCGDGTDKSNNHGGWGCENNAPAWCI